MIYKWFKFPPKKIDIYQHIGIWALSQRDDHHWLFSSTGWMWKAPQERTGLIKSIKVKKTTASGIVYVMKLWIQVSKAEEEQMGRNFGTKRGCENVHIGFWSGIGQNVQKMAIFGPKWPKMHILDQIWPFLGQKS